MRTVNATDLRNNFFKMLKTCAKYNEPLNIRSKTGNLVLLREAEYKGLKETAFLNTIPKVNCYGRKSVAVDFNFSPSFQNR